MDSYSFQTELTRPRLNLPRAALCLAREIAYPGLPIDTYLDQLKDLAAQFQARCPASTPALEQAETLADFLFHEIGLRGNSLHYEDPRNSFINEVLDRHLGIPISLSVIYIAVARRAGLRAAGVGLPGHFIVRIEGDGKPLYLDPFNGGVRLDTATCARLVQHATGHTGPFNPAWLNPTGPRAILTRMLTNLRNIYVRSEAWAPALTTIHHLLVTQPRLASHWRDLGLVYYRNAEIQKAIYCLEAYLLRNSEASDSPQIAQRLHAIVQEYARQN